MEHSIRALRMRESEDILVPFIQRCKNIAELKQVHARVCRYFLSESSFLVTKMVDVCDGCNEMGYGSLLFRQVKDPNGFLFNVMIRGFTHNGVYSWGMSTYKQMVWSMGSRNGRSLVVPDRFTFPFVLKCCAGLGYHELGKQVHGHLCKFGSSSHLLTENALIDMYAKGGSLLDACRVFDDMSERDPISWNAVISGHARLGQMKKASTLFDSMPCRTVVSWTAMISGYAGAGSFVDALLVFRSMQESGVKPDQISIVSVLPACAQLGALEVGKWIHKYCCRNGLRNTNVYNALIEMYSKCGCIDEANQLFDHMSSRDVISWSTMIAGLANHGKALEAIDLFERMKQTKIQPNSITFTGLLSACSHAGLWRNGLAYFDSMRKEYGIDPEIEHYGSMIDLLGRVGRIREALDMIEKMPMKPGAVIWGSLLSSCRTHCNLEIATIAMEHLSELEPDDTGNFVLLSNIYADLGKWKGVSKMRKLIRSKRMKKTPGCSLIEVNNIVHEFSSGFDQKLYTQEIFWLLELIKFDSGVANNTDIALRAKRDTWFPKV